MGGVEIAEAAGIALGGWYDAAVICWGIDTAGGAADG